MRETDSLLDMIRNEARLLKVYASVLRQHEKMSEAASLIAKLAVDALDTPSAYVGLLYSDTQTVVAEIGLDGATEFPIRETYCQHLVAGELVVINDSTIDERVKDLDVTTREGGIRTYLGAPLIADGQVIGSLCVYDTEVREWRPDEIDLISRLADSLMGVGDSVAKSLQLQDSA